VAPSPATAAPPRHQSSEYVAGLEDDIRGKAHALAMSEARIHSLEQQIRANAASNGESAGNGVLCDTAGCPNDETAGSRDPFSTFGQHSVTVGTQPTGASLNPRVR
jgi:hypothetical protein